jgi:hypothetical protein
MAADLSDFREAIKGVIKLHLNQIKEDDILLGKVVKIHDDPDNEHYGTVDVRPTGGEWPIITYVRVNAVMQSAKRGLFTFPKLNSDVIITKYHRDSDAVILLYSHIEKMESIIDEEIISRVQKVTTNNPSKYLDVTEDADEFTHIRQTTTDIELKGASIKMGSDMEEDFEPAVLGTKLADLLTEVLDMLAAATVTTAIGPQPFLPDTQVKINDIKAKVEDIKSAIVTLQ